LIEKIEELKLPKDFDLLPPEKARGREMRQETEGGRAWQNHFRFQKQTDEATELAKT
jgi:hypothetical protein